MIRLMSSVYIICRAATALESAEVFIARSLLLRGGRAARVFTQFHN